MLHPDLNLRVSAEIAHVDFTDGDIDVAVRHGDGDWPALVVTRMCDEFWLPVCRPDVLEHGARAGDLLRETLIHHRDASAWRQWFEVRGIVADPAVQRGLTFSEMSLAIDAATAGQGVALARSALSARDLIAGRLICPVPDFRPTEIGYWIVRPKGRATNKKVTRFIAWLLAEAAAEQQALQDLFARERR
jgi:LysR family glycine cleavage system transcriptional activator